MKGQAIITIKDKNGKIKNQVTEKNVVFDIPKELIKQLIKNADLGPIGARGSESSSSSASLSSAAANITAYSDWFRSIKVNDETCSEADYKDWKMPVLYGGEVAKADQNNARYVQYDAVNSSKNGAILKKAYTWNNCPAFTLRSINLCHFYNSVNQGGSGNNFINRTNQKYAVKSKNILFTKFNAGSASDWFGNGQMGRIEKKGSFTWAGYGQATMESKLVNGRGRWDSFCFSQPAIFPLKSDEVAVMKNSDNMTTEEQSTFWNYIVIIDAETGNVKRSFSKSQFTGLVTNSGTPNNDHSIIVATSFGSFLVANVNNGTGNNAKIWKIPEETTAESIEVYADLTSYTFSAYYTMTAIKNYVIDLANRKTIRINNDANNPVTYYDYAPIQVNTSHTFLNINAFNEFYELAGTDGAFEVWYNTTALNLSEGVAVAAGDTLTIEYTIAAN